MLACQMSRQAEYLSAAQVQAAFIYNFTKYTEWPSQPADADTTHFHLCVVGDNPVTEQLDTAIQGKVAANRTIQIRHIGNEANLSGCEVLYVGNVSRQTEERLLAALSAQPILTLGSLPGFLRGQGMVTFVVEDNRVRFDINTRIAEKVNIRFDSRILALARKRIEAPR
jgi:hypothetical protein